MKRVLLIEDDSSARELAQYNLEEAGFAVIPYQDPLSALNWLKENRVDLILSDLKLPKISGIELLESIDKIIKSRPPFIIMTAYGTVELAVKAMKQGAFDFILKPFSKDQLLIAVKRALEHIELKKENKALKAKLNKAGLVFKSKKMEAIVEQALLSVASDMNILITGESGTGKELLARFIYYNRQERKGEFIAVNCGAISHSLIESELFGHIKGAFTGAEKERLGKLKVADGGVLFLDEISLLPLTLQPKLLRAIENREITPLGADFTVKFDAKIISATNDNLRKMINSKEFRQDLFYRLAGIEIEVPPLRERKEDILFLTDNFLKEYATLDTELSDEVKNAFINYNWPGNVRELKTICKRLALFCSGRKITIEDLPQYFSKKDKSIGNNFFIDIPDGGINLVDIERSVIESALIKAKGNITKAASLLNVPRHILAYRMQKYGICHNNENNK